MSTNRVAVKFAGESGQGINTLGKLLSKALKDTGFGIFAYREYPSLIKGGFASYQVDISSKEIASSSANCDILAVLDEDAMHQYIQSLNMGGIVLYDDKEIVFTADEKKYVKENNISLIYIDTVKIALDNRGNEIMANVVMLGSIWRVLGVEVKPLERVIRKYFAKKDVDIEAEVRCLKGGFDAKEIGDISLSSKLVKRIKGWSKSKLLTGNDAIALGAIAAGCRAYYAYPMTPATSILEVLGNTYKETGVLIKQAESEITAAQMVLGSMYMGTRAMTATSGGGFDLMTETISCSGMSETPFVVILAQRNGPGTGVPTWTGAGDLRVALNCGHGEFPRCVLSAGDPSECFELTQKAFDIAEKYQIPVILLTEKQVAESIFNISKLPKTEKVKRYFKEGKTRYEVTESGISPRWIPSSKNVPYLSTSDEHLEDGTSTENAESVSEMMGKRSRKLSTLYKEIPEPEYFGSGKPEIVFVGTGSVKNCILDALKNQKREVGYLHYKYIYPLRTDTLEKLYEDDVRLISVENNQTGQLTDHILTESGIEIVEKLLKFDGRPFFVEDILDFLSQE